MTKLKKENEKENIFKNSSLINEFSLLKYEKKDSGTHLIGLVVWG